MSLTPFKYAKHLLLSFGMLLFFNVSFSGEGMWLPTDLKRKEAAMKALGLQIPVEKIFNTDGTGLNRAVVLFGSGCTGEVISNQGLLLTNHHCGYGTVQSLSGLGKDYFAQGFWAMNNQQELPCPGLSVTFINDLREVTPSILSGLDKPMKESSRDSIIEIRIKNLEKGFKELGMDEVRIKPFFQGNQYWAIISETFTDIRLVGFPPNGIGSFGGDTDNWMWPRHTGDFSLFRIYANGANKPATYATTNKPFRPKVFFPIDASGVKEGDFTMIYGFPGSTQEYISSYQLDQIYSIIDPIRIEARTARLNVWKQHMATDRNVFLQYTSKKAGVANGWKKWQGEVRGLKLNKVVEKKKDYEQQFQRWAMADTTLPEADLVLSTIAANATLANQAIRSEEYFKEAVMGIELLAAAASISSQIKNINAAKSQDVAIKAKKRLAENVENFYKNYDVATDKDVFTALMNLYFQKNGNGIPSYAVNQLHTYNGSISNWADNLYNNSILAQPQKMKDLIKADAADLETTISNDPAVRLYKSFASMREQEILPVLKQNQDNMVALNRSYMKSQMALNKTKDFYPDANLTLRLTYGTVKGIDPDGPAPYSYQTWLSEAIAKADPSVEEFNMPQKLKDLYYKKDFGRWGNGRDVPIAFIGLNHTTGGNSGSPVLNGKGQLIGTNFDRIWEGTMSDLYFDENLSRNISVDIRYTLFIIEKFGNAGWLLKEMQIKL